LEFVFILLAAAPALAGGGMDGMGVTGYHPLVVVRTHRSSSGTNSELHPPNLF
jgi:hypothetical protein